MIRAFVFRTFGVLFVALVAGLTQVIVMMNRPRVYVGNGAFMRLGSDINLQSFFMGWFITALDNGSLQSLQLANPNEAAFVYALAGMAAMMGCMALLTAFYLWFSVWSAKRHGLLGE